MERKESPRAVEASALADRRAVEDFLFYEARLLDGREFETWRELFLEDGYYWVPLRAEQEDPVNEVSLFYDTKSTMQTRIERLRHPRIHSQTPHTRTCRLVNNVHVREQAGDACTVESNLVFVDYRQGMQRVFAGHVLHRLTQVGGHGQVGGEFRIAWKKVTLVNCDDVHEVIAVPF